MALIAFPGIRDHTMALDFLVSGFLQSQLPLYVHTSGQYIYQMK